MNICGEHGDDIAYVGKYCPACEEVEELNKDHRIEIEDLEFSHQEEIDSLNNQIAENER